MVAHPVEGGGLCQAARAGGASAFPALYSKVGFVFQPGEQFTTLLKQHGYIAPPVTRQAGRDEMRVPAIYWRWVPKRRPIFQGLKPLT